MKLLTKCLYLFAFSTLVSCKKENTTPTINLTGNDSGKSISVTNGEVIILTLDNPGNGGYQFINPAYNAAVLTLNSHTHQNPSNSNLLGNSGQDTWKFTSVSTGTSTLKISASRVGIVRDTTSLFTAQINIR